MKHKSNFETLIMGFLAVTWARVWFVFVFLWLFRASILQKVCFAVSLAVDFILCQKLFQPLQMSPIKRILLHVLSYVIAILLALYLVSGSFDPNIKLSSLALFPG